MKPHNCNDSRYARHAREIKPLISAVASQMVPWRSAAHRPSRAADRHYIGESSPILAKASGAAVSGGAVQKAAASPGNRKETNNETVTEAVGRALFGKSARMRRLGERSALFGVASSPSAERTSASNIEHRRGSSRAVIAAASPRPVGIRQSPEPNNELDEIFGSNRLAKPRAGV